MSKERSNEEIIQKVRQEVAAAAAQELFHKMTDLCFEKCVTRPGAKLSNAEQNCLAKCMDRYVDVIGVVSRTISQRPPSNQ